MADTEVKEKLLVIGQCYDLKSLEKGAKIISKVWTKRRKQSEQNT